MFIQMENNSNEIKEETMSTVEEEQINAVEMAREIQPAEPEFVVVTERLDEDSERIELPTNSADKTLGLQTLTRAFPGAHGLKYKNKSSGAFRALLTDQSGSKFFPPPPDGWTGKTFIVIYQQSQESAQRIDKKVIIATKKNDQNAKRRKLMIESDDGENSADSDVDNDKVSASDKRQRGQRSRQKRQKDESKPNDQEEQVVTDDLCDDVVTDLIVLGLPFKNFTDAELKAYFEQYGNVVHSEIKTSKGVSKGFGFVQMSNIDEQRKILRKGAHIIGGRKCQVRVPYNKDRENPLSNKVYIGNLTDAITRDQLVEFFTTEAAKIQPDSSVLDVYIPKPFRAFAFITFSSPKIAKEILKKSEFSMNGATLFSSTANPRLSNQSSSMNFGNFGRHVPRDYPEKIVHHDWLFENVNANRGAYDRRFYDNEPPYTPTFQSQTSAQFFGSRAPQSFAPPVAGAGMLSTGLETLNLNNMKPEVVSAIKNLINVAAQSGEPSTSSLNNAYRSLSPGVRNGRASPHHQHQQGSNPARYRSGPSQYGQPSWR